uniref:Uncharacterized protein n=1 Tax=Fagus sylvatica TaxID=28930 RepID=A0A2N9IXU8_FAGSY
MVESGCSGFANHLITGKWTSVFASFLIMAGAGATYLFAVYSGDIKKNLGYNQSMLNSMSTSKDIGANVGILSGLLAEVAPTWFVLVIGSLTNFIGYLMIWLAVTGRIAKPELWHMCVYIFIAANSQNFANTGSLVTCVKNFPESRSIMLGLLKGYVGLSGSLLTQICLAIYGDDTTSLILFIAWMPALISLVFVYTIQEKEVKVKQENELKVFYQFLYLSIALAVFLMAMTLTQQHKKFKPKEYMASAIVSCIIMCLPAVVAIRQELLLWRKMKELTTEKIVEKPLAIDPFKQSPSNNGEQQPKKSFFADIFNKPKRGEDYSILQAILSIDMLIIFISTIVGIGSCLTAIDNLGQIGESLQYETKTTKTFVSLVSIWNYCGRVFSGFISEILLMKYKIPRPLLLSAVLFLSSIGYLMIAFPFNGSIYVASLIIGFTFGAQLPLIFAIISEIFGLKHYSTLFNCGQVAIPIGSFLLNKELTGKSYDREALKMHGLEGLEHRPKLLVCQGKQCFALPFKVMALATFLGAVISLILVVRTWEFYKNFKGETYIQFDEEEKKKKKGSDTASSSARGAK